VRVDARAGLCVAKWIRGSDPSSSEEGTAEVIGILRALKMQDFCGFNMHFEMPFCIQAWIPL
jgi:hypothetical protein